MIAVEDRVGDDLLGFEIAEIDDRQPAVRLVIDEEELTVILAPGLAQGGMVRIPPGERPPPDTGGRARGRQRRLLHAVAVALPRLGREDGDAAQDPHRWEPDRQHLPRVAARCKHDIFIELSRWCVRGQCCRDIVRRKAAILDEPVRIGGENREGRRHGGLFPGPTTGDRNQRSAD